MSSDWTPRATALRGLSQVYGRRAGTCEGSCVGPVFKILRSLVKSAPHFPPRPHPLHGGWFAQTRHVSSPFAFAQSHNNCQGLWLAVGDITDPNLNSRSHVQYLQSLHGTQRAGEGHLPPCKRVFQQTNYCRERSARAYRTIRVVLMGRRLRTL